MCKKDEKFFCKVIQNEQEAIAWARHLVNSRFEHSVNKVEEGWEFFLKRKNAKEAGFK